MTSASTVTAPASHSAPPTTADGNQGSNRSLIRGSSLVLVGRVVSLGINFAVQVMVVRYLTKADYGAFAYALSITLFTQMVVKLGLDRAVTRFLPIYDEQHSYDRLLGTLLFVLAVVVGLGVLAVAAVFLIAVPLHVPLARGGDARTLLLILIAMVPLAAVNDLFVGLFAVFSRPKAIFFRRYLLTAGLRLVAAVILIAANTDVELLAVGYVLTEAVGVVLSLAIFVQILQTDGLLAKFRKTSPRVPAREILSFTVPLLTTDLVYAAMILSDALLLGHFRGSEAVATLRAIQPAAQMNQIVFSSFLFLFTPAVSRLFARDDRQGVDDVYWHTAGWVAILSSPIFLLTFSLAVPLTGLLFGARYADSAMLLALLSLGYYVQAAMGFNGTTLMVLGKVRALVALNVIVIIVNVGANVVAIPQWGAVGAAVATTSTLIVHNLLKQATLRRSAGVRFFRLEYTRIYATVVTAALGVLLAQRWFDAAIPSFALGAIGSGLVLLVASHALNVPEAFPELLRIPLVRRVVAPSRTP